ncbi:MAG: adenylosuccinate lyase [Halioglobus sp.]|jgi:adenylosuccinate lyase
MSAIHAMEIRISRDLIRRRERRASQSIVERVITAVSALAALGMLALFFPSVFWLLALGAVVLCLGA